MNLIVPRLFSLSGLMVGRVYLTEDADGGFTLIDTSISRSAPNILKQLAEAGHAPTDVRRIIITHAHPDHVGGLPALKSATGAEVIASFVERPYIEGKLAVVQPDRASLPLFWRLLYQKPTALTGTPVDREVADGDVIPEVFGGLQVIFTPGHSPGHISLWQAEKGVLITGDVIMNPPLIGMRSPVSAFTPNMDDNRRAVQRIAALKPSLVCFGHGKPISEDAAAVLAAYARKDVKYSSARSSADVEPPA